MDAFNFPAIIVAAIVPLLISFFWYNPKLFGNTLTDEVEMTEAKMKGGNMAVTFGATLLLSFFLAFFIQFLAIHQTGVVALVGGDPLIAKPSFEAFMADYGNDFRTFKHGALHGALAGLFIIFPIIAINGMFERKRWKYIFVNSAYWLVSAIAMGAIVCGWTK